MVNTTKAAETTAINTSPALTWNWLKMNEAQLSLAASGEATKLTRASHEVKNLSDGIFYKEKFDGFDPAKIIDGQKIETGATASADVFFDKIAPTIFHVNKNCQIEKPVLVNYNLKDSEKSAAWQVIHAEENASVTVIIVSSSDKTAAGFEALRTYCVAEKNSHIHLVKLQLLGSDFVQVDDTGVWCAENASVEVTQVMLGSSECYAGVAASLAGYKSSFKSDTAYLCAGMQILDMNYVVRHVAPKTECRMKVAGTLRDKAKKTYRGSIDFIKGCTGANGEETEDVLLLSPTATNKSIPLILCGEEDVAGEHGASIGRLGEDVLFYMQNRGISRSEAENLIARAKVDAVLELVPDAETVALAEKFLGAEE